MYIGIDARPLIKNKSGIGYFLDNILKGILEEDKENIYYLISDKDIFFEEKKYPNVKKYIYKNGKVVRKSFYFFFLLHKQLKKDNIKLDVFWGTQHFLPLNLKCKKVLTVHDISFKIFPETVDAKVRLISNLMFKPSVKRADHIVCVSNYTKKLLLQNYNKSIKSKDVSVVYISGNESKDYNNEEDILKKYNLKSGKYILFISTIEPRKNVDVLLDAMDKIDTELSLVVCGKEGWKCENTMERLKKAENILYLNYVSDNEKDCLLKNALSFVMPSVCEGFGIPVVEAMQADIPVIVANNSSLQELVEYEALRFETFNSTALAELICKMYNDEIFYEKAKEYCVKRKLSFSWKNTSKKYAEILKGVEK